MDVLQAGFLRDQRALFGGFAGAIMCVVPNAQKDNYVNYLSNMQFVHLNPFGGLTTNSK